MRDAKPPEEIPNPVAVGKHNVVPGAARLAALGRAGHTARRALPLLRRQGALTMPILAEDLGISRPAATETLERLTATGCAEELTGRARDRVWGYAPKVLRTRT